MKFEDKTTETKITEDKTLDSVIDALRHGVQMTDDIHELRTVATQLLEHIVFQQTTQKTHTQNMAVAMDVIAALTATANGTPGDAPDKFILTAENVKACAGVPYIVTIEPDVMGEMAVVLRRTDVIDLTAVN